MAVKVAFNGEDGQKNFADDDAREYRYAFGTAGILYVVAGPKGNGNLESYSIVEVYGPTAWFKVSGDIYDNGTLWRLGFAAAPR